MLAGDPGRDPAGIPGEGAELGIAERLRENARLARVLGRAGGIPDAARDQGAGTRRTVRCRALEGIRDPAVDEVATRPAAPHPRAQGGLEAQFGVELGALLVRLAELDRAHHRVEERIAVVPQGVRLADDSPEPALSRRVGLELERALEHAERVVDLVATNGESGGPLEPGAGQFAKALQLALVARPGEIGVGGPDGFVVVMCEEARVLVALLADALEPGGECCVEPRAPRRRQARVGDVPCQGMLERELTLAGERRAGAAPDEIARLEYGEIGCVAVEELPQRSAPEDAADHRCRLERRLLDRRQQVDARREHRVDGVRHLLGVADVACLGAELLQEEGIALGALDDLAAELAVEVAAIERDQEGMRPRRR